MTYITTFRGFINSIALRKRELLRQIDQISGHYTFTGQKGFGGFRLKNFEEEEPMLPGACWGRQADCREQTNLSSSWMSIRGSYPENAETADP